MIRTQVYLPEDLYHDLKLIAQTQKVKFSQLIRLGVENVVRKEKKKRAKSDSWKEFVGALKYGPKDLSTRVNDIYK